MAFKEKKKNVKRKLGVAYIEDGGRRVDSIEVSK